jgi:nicotinamidase/pyrazinamidase
MIGTNGAKRIAETCDSQTEEFSKTSYDVFTNLATELVLKTYDVKEAVVYGVATDYCVKAAVLGMQKRGIQCYVVEDAIAGVSPDTTSQAIYEMKEAGAVFIKTEDVLNE